MTGDGHRTATPAEHDSETQTGGPEEAGAHQVLFGFTKARCGWEVELFCAPINCCFGTTLEIIVRNQTLAEGGEQGLEVSGGEGWRSIGMLSGEASKSNYVGRQETYGAS